MSFSKFSFVADARSWPCNTPVVLAPTLPCLFSQSTFAVRLLAWWLFRTNREADGHLHDEEVKARRGVCNLSFAYSRKGLASWLVLTAGRAALINRCGLIEELVVTPPGRKGAMQAAYIGATTPMHPGWRCYRCLSCA